MSSLLLVRHGQASFMAKDYDQLSPLGIQQAESLARFWTQRGLVFDQLITGPRERQRHTMQIITDAYACAALPCPTALAEPAFDEHHLEPLIRQQREPGHSPPALYHPTDHSADAKRSRQYFYQLLESLAIRWLNADPETHFVEPWVAFRERVRHALYSLRQHSGRGRRIAITTSAGVIGVALQEALGCSDLQAMQLSWRLRNTSLTEFVFSGTRFTLDSFNNLPHLPDRQWWTHL